MRKFIQVISFLGFILLYVSCNRSEKKTVSSNNNSIKNRETPIDCPLRKQGINMDHMKPFAEVEKYIEFLERKDRATWQKPDAVISAMKLIGTETIADVGAGSGYFSFRFASKVPEGKVIAIDIEPEMIRHIHHKIMSSDINNMEVVLASEDDPKISEKVDIVFICDVLHHLKNRAKWLEKLNSEISKGTKLILIEFKEGNLPEGPPEKIKISGKEMVAMVNASGFALVEKNVTLLPYQNYFVFEKK
jgi:ubiquinone/menaquinone biosynthesis C-methylase UbiE